MSARELLQGLRIAVLYGGRSGEREVSLASAKTVLGVLAEGGYVITAVDTGESRWWQQLTEVDIAFNIQHGAGGEDGVTQGLLQAMGIVGTGSGVLGSALAMDKLRSKQIWLTLGLPTAEFELVGEHTDVAALLERWGGAFIKPCNEGSSLGMARVTTVDEFRTACEDAARFDAQVLAERLIDGPEYTVAVLGERALPPIRIESARSFYDYEAKYQADSTRYHVPCGLDANTERQMCALALAAFRALDCEVWGRVDLMRDSNGSFQLLEVNTVPGMTDHSLVPMAARAASLSLLELLEEIMLLSWQSQQAQLRGAA